MFRAMAIRRFLCSVVALESPDLLLSCSVITNNNIIAHNHHTNNSPYIFLHLSTSFYIFLHFSTLLHLYIYNIYIYNGTMLTGTVALLRGLSYPSSQEVRKMKTLSSSMLHYLANKAQEPKKE